MAKLYTIVFKISDKYLTTCKSTALIEEGIGRIPQLISNTFSYSFEGYRKIHEYMRIKRKLFSTHLTLVSLMKNIKTG